MSMEKGQERSYQLFSSTRFDPFLATLSWNDDHDGPCSFFLLPYHFDRLVSAARTHKWDHLTSVLSYDYLKSACLDAISEQNSSPTAFKVNPCIPFQCKVLSFRYRFELHFHKMVKSSWPQPLWRRRSRRIQLYYPLINLHPLIIPKILWKFTSIPKLSCLLSLHPLKPPFGTSTTMLGREIKHVCKRVRTGVDQTFSYTMTRDALWKLLYSM